jgi:hypothetical protein
LGPGELLFARFPQQIIPVSDIAVLPPEVRSALAEQDGLPHDADMLTALQDARTAAAAELRAEAARRTAGTTAVPEGIEGAEPTSAHDPEVAQLLSALAERLERQRVAAGVDQLVHELLSDLLTDALTAPVTERTAYLTARAFALKVIARHAPLWPGAGPRLGCSYGYDSVLAVVRRSAEATGA